MNTRILNETLVEFEPNNYSAINETISISNNLIFVNDNANDNDNNTDNNLIEEHTNKNILNQIVIWDYTVFEICIFIIQLYTVITVFVILDFWAFAPSKYIYKDKLSISIILSTINIILCIFGSFLGYLYLE